VSVKKQELNLHQIPAKLFFFLSAWQDLNKMILINKLSSMCMECKEAIYNPICSKCLSKEMTAWLHNKDERLKRVVTDEVKKILYRSKFFENEICAICGNKGVFLCPYCFTEKVYKRLKREGSSKNILVEFLTLFNFDFRHTYLTKEAEKLGMF